MSEIDLLIGVGWLYIRALASFIGTNGSSNYLLWSSNCLL